MAEEKKSTLDDLTEKHATLLQELDQIAELREAVCLYKLVSGQTDEDLLVTEPDPDVIVPQAHTKRLTPDEVKLFLERKEKDKDLIVLQQQIAAIAENRLANDKRTGSKSLPTRVEEEFKERFDKANADLQRNLAAYTRVEDEYKARVQALKDNKAKHRDLVAEAYKSLSLGSRKLLPKEFLKHNSDEQLIRVEQLHSMKKLEELQLSTELQSEQTATSKKGLDAMQDALLQNVNKLVLEQMKGVAVQQDLDRFRAEIEKCVTDQTHFLHQSALERMSGFVKAAVIATKEAFVVNLEGATPRAAQSG